MNSKRVVAFVAMFVLVVMVVMLAVPFIARGAVPPVEKTNAQPFALNDKIKMQNYTVDPGGYINKGDVIKLTVQFIDSRGPTTGQAVAMVKTSSFIPSSDKYFADQSGRSYTIDFYITYTGVGKTFACDILHDDGLTPSTITTETVSFEIPACQPYQPPSPEPPPPTSTPEPVVRGTGFVLKAASYGKSETTAGQEFNLTASFVATNGTSAVENVSVTIALDKNFKLSTGSSVLYIGTVYPGRTFSVSFTILPSAVLEEGSYMVSLTVKGVNAGDGTSAEATADITVPVIQPERFEMGNVMLPDGLFVGSEDGYVTIDLVNKGKGTIFNVSAEIVGDGLSTSEGNQFIGNILPGTQASAEFSLKASELGELKGEIIVTYENAQGEEKTLSRKFTILAEEDGFMPFPPDNSGFEEPAKGGGWLWIVLIIAALVIGAVVAFLLIIRAKAKKNRALAEAKLDEDFDDEFAELPPAAEMEALPPAEGTLPAEEAQTPKE